jgi:copper resistance protein D
MYIWSVYLHLIIAAFWIGGMLFTAAVLVPATRKKLAEQRGLLFTELGTRFSRLTWILFPLLIITGITALYGRGFDTGQLISASFWDSSYGSTLMGKLHFFALVLIISGIHDFWLGPKAALLMESDPDKPLTNRFRKAAGWVGRINLLLGLFILYYAVKLVRW